MTLKTDIIYQGRLFFKREHKCGWGGKEKVHFITFSFLRWHTWYSKILVTINALLETVKQENFVVWKFCFTVTSNKVYGEIIPVTLGCNVEIKNYNNNL